MALSDLFDKPRTGLLLQFLDLGGLPVAIQINAIFGLNSTFYGNVVVGAAGVNVGLTLR